MEIISKKDVGQLMELSTVISSEIQFALTERMKTTFKMSEKEMTELIEALHTYK